MKISKDVIIGILCGVYLAGSLVWIGYTEWRVERITVRLGQVIEGHLSVRDYVLKRLPLPSEESGKQASPASNPPGEKEAEQK